MLESPGAKHEDAEDQVIERRDSNVLFHQTPAKTSVDGPLA